MKVILLDTKISTPVCLLVLLASDTISNLLTLGSIYPWYWGVFLVCSSRIDHDFATIWYLVFCVFFWGGNPLILSSYYWAHWLLILSHINIQILLMFVWCCLWCCVLERRRKRKRKRERQREEDRDPSFVRLFIYCAFMGIANFMGWSFCFSTF